MMMKKIVILKATNSYDDLHLLEYCRSMFVNEAVIPIEISNPYKHVMRNLLKFCYETRPDIIIGASAGAMFVQQLHGYKKILINPVLHISWKCASTEDIQFGGITNYDKEHTYAFFSDAESQGSAYTEYEMTYKNVVRCSADLDIQKLIETHVHATIKKMLDEGPDKEYIDAIRAYELLSEISGGGRVGRAALLNLAEELQSILKEVTTVYYSNFYDVRETAWEGFTKITRDFVSDVEEIPYLNYTKYLYGHLHTFFEREVKEKNLMIAADAGNLMAPIKALTNLAHLYIDSPEESIEKTLAFEAGTQWLKRYNNESLEKKRWSDKAGFIDVIPFLIGGESPEFDRIHIETDEMLNKCLEILPNLSKDTVKALCWGVNQLYQAEKHSSFFVLMKVLVNEDNVIDTTEHGIYFSLYDAEMAMLDWTSNNRKHVLCYIIRKVPRCKPFYDDFVKAVQYWEEEQLVDNLYNSEYVYMSTGFQRKQNYKVGDEVQYICNDGKNTVLKRSSITQLPTSNDSSISLLDGSRVPTRYVFSII